MRHDPSSRFCRTPTWALLAACALLPCLAVAHAAKKPAPPVAKVYSAEQQSAALDALTETLGSLDKLEQKLLPAYGGASAIIRMERIKEGPIVSEGPSATGVAIDKEQAGKAPRVKHPELEAEQKAAGVREQSIKTSSAIIKRVASLEPLSSQCGLTDETLNTLGVLSDQAAALVERRYKVDAATRADWLAAGHQNGLQRLTMVHELDCGPVRHALEDSLSGFQNIYAKLYSVVQAQPEMDPTPVGAVSASAAAGVSVNGVLVTGAAATGGPAAGVPATGTAAAGAAVTVTAPSSN